MRPRIAITGIGVVSTFGAGRETYWSQVSRGISGTRAITEFDASGMPCRVAAAVPPIDEPMPVLAGEEQAPELRADPKRYSRAALIAVTVFAFSDTIIGLFDTTNNAVNSPTP